MTSTEPAHPDRYSAEILNAVQLVAQSQWQGVLDALRPAADEGDRSALLLFTFAGNQLGQPIAQMLPRVEQALDEGVFLPAMSLVGRMVSEPAHHEDLLRLLDRILDVFPGWDVTGWVTTIAQSAPQMAARFAAIIAKPRYPTPREWELIRADSDALLTTLRTAAATVEEDRARAVEAIGDHAESVAGERARVEKLVTDTTRLVHEVTADHMAQSYASRANATLSAALRWTAAAIAVAIVAVAWGIYVGAHASANDASTSTILGKALVTLPLIAIAAYLGNVAAATRRMGWHWRHVELQIMTAEPFIAELDDDTRKALQAALAIRFFPGQGQDPQNSGPQSETVDLSSVIAEVFRELRGGRTTPPTTN